MFGFKSEPSGEGETDWCASIGMSKPRPKRKKKNYTEKGKMIEDR